MEHKTQVELAQRIFNHIDRGTTSESPAPARNDVSVYTDPDRFARERNLFFRSSPIIAGLSCQVRNPGDYYTDDLPGMPILLVRSRVAASMHF